MEYKDHLRLTGTAVKNWFVAQCMDSAAVGLLWLVGLLIIGVPFAPLWALLAAAFQFIPQIGGVFACVAPVVVAWFTDNSEPIVALVPNDVLYVLILYAIIAFIDGLFLQPYLMKRTSKVPMWASILAPIVLGIFLPFWGVLLAPPLLAVIYAYRAARAPKPPAQVIEFPAQSGDQRVER